MKPLCSISDIKITTFGSLSHVMQSCDLHLTCMCSLAVLSLCEMKQVDCLAQVMSKNFLSRRDNSSAHLCTDGAQTTKKGTPLKFLLIGCSLSLLLTTKLDADTPPVSCQLATPLMLATVYNPVCVVELSGRDTKMEASCFNMAVSYSLEQASLCTWRHSLASP